ncbi:GntP family permease [Flavobacterium sp.]|uniref:GntP family permease n=1 Tax=Flavobacterium sp. TaxID=239 RepID=UPI0037935A82
MSLFLTLFLVVFALIVLISLFKINPFISFLIVSIIAGLALGIPYSKITAAVQKGIGDMMASIVIVICLGAMIGKLVAESGAAKVIADRIIQLFGVKYIQWGMLLTGFIIGIPLFYNIGFVLVIPIIFSLVYQYKISPMLVGLPMLASLSAAHAFLPPHPSPVALIAVFNADMGKTLFLGILCAIPSIIIAGPLFSKTIKNIGNNNDETLYKQEVISSQSPSVIISFVAALMPVGIISFAHILPYFFSKESEITSICTTIGDPTIVMILSLITSTYLLGIRLGKSIKELMGIYENAIKEIFMILLIIGGSGALKEVLIQSGAGDQIAVFFEHVNIHPLLLAWLIAATIRVCLGSATVAGLTTAGIVAPMMQHIQVDTSLMVLAIGAGSIMFSHVNDSGFWLFKEYFKLSIKDTFRTWTLMESLLSVVGIICVMILNYVLPML